MSEEQKTLEEEPKAMLARKPLKEEINEMLVRLRTVQCILPVDCRNTHDNETLDRCLKLVEAVEAVLLAQDRSIAMSWHEARRELAHAIVGLQEALLR